MAHRVTQKEIARLAGVSVNTVSQALRGSPRISEATRKRVRELAETHGYRPDPALSALVAHRMQQAPAEKRATLVLLLNWKDSRWWIRQARSGRETVAGIRSACDLLGYTLEILSLPEQEMPSQRLLRTLGYRGIRGLILAPPDIEGEVTPERRFWPSLDWSGFSVVALEPVTFYPKVHYVAPNHFSAIGMIWEQLRGQGYRRPGLVLTEEAVQRVRYRWAAAHLVEQERLRAKDRVPRLILKPEEECPVRHQLQDWIARYQPDVMISKTLYQIMDEGLSCTKRAIPYVSLNRTDEFSPVPGIDQNRPVMGQMAVSLLHSLILRNQTGEQLTISGTLVEGRWVGSDLPATP